MFEIKLTVEMPDLVRAVEIVKNTVEVSASQRGSELGALLDVLKQDKCCCQADTPEEEPVAPYTAPAVPLPDPTPVTPAPAPAPAPVAPTAAPAFTLAQVARAGAQLLTSKPELQKPLMDLLGKYGAKTAQQLPLDRLGEFAAELRQMGAQI